MAINKNHEFEDLEGIKCAIVERNVSQERIDFLTALLQYNRYTIIVVATPPKVAAKPAAVAMPAEESEIKEEVSTAPTFTIGVTDVTFNAINAIFGRLLHTPGGHVVTFAYWQQRDEISRDEIPYYEEKKY
ncbi:MAG: hypothetical protein H0W62_02205 [Chitinophagales bacterium]|nr:hypothetical protein [Chitinophagales bacterium]